MTHSEAAVAGSHLRVLSINTSKLCSLVVGEVIHRELAKVEAITSVVDGQDIYSLAVVGDPVAGAALQNT